MKIAKENFDVMTKEEIIKYLNNEIEFQFNLKFDSIIDEKNEEIESVLLDMLSRLKIVIK